MKLQHKRYMKQLDQEITAAFYRHGSNVHFDIMELGEMKAFARNAVSSIGLTVDQAMILAIAKYRKN